MSRPHVLIVGAGIAGTCLASLLKRQGISFVLLDKAAKAQEYSYTISLEKRAYSPLLQALGLSEDAFRKTIAIEKGSGESLRVPRTTFENFIRDASGKSLDVQWNSHVQTISRHRDGGISVATQDNKEFAADLAVAADGVHSHLRELLLPSEKPVVLPYVAINGKRRLPLEQADSILSHFNASGSMQKGDTRLSYSAMAPKETGHNFVALSYTFSRPPHPGNDALHRPERSNAGAKDVPNDFYQELTQLQPLPEPFRSIFAAESVRSDRLLHWLMRTSLLPREQLGAIWGANRVVFVADAAHPLPILGGSGANEAIQDALALSNILTQSRPADSLYKERHADWQAAVEQARRNLKFMHANGTSAL